MTQQFAMSDPQLAVPEPAFARFGDAFVILSATLVSLAAGASLIVQLGFDLSYTILVALGTYCALLVLHLLARRRLVANATAGWRREDVAADLHWQTGAAAFEAALARQATRAEDAAAGVEEELEPSVSGVWSDRLPMPEPSEVEESQAFRYRPSRIPYFEGAEEEQDTPAAQMPVGGLPVRPPASGALSPEINVEVIQDLIKKLADELNGPSTRADDDVSAGADAMLGRSIAALDAAARAMRTPPEGRLALEPPSGLRGGQPRRGTPPPLDSQLARIAEAVAAERFEVLIEPIHALAEGRPRHYEVTMRLRTADGSSMEQADYVRAAQSSDLLPQIDAARMLRAARVARRLSERGRQGSVLSAMTGDSITDNGFLDAAAQEATGNGWVRLVLAFAQSDARAFTPAHAEALGAMAAAGFGFALEDVTDLDMDFGKLKALGFEFVKLDAQVFLEGMQAPGGCIPATDICRYLSEFGLTLIIGAIEDDWLLAKVMGFGVLLGKGALFGGPRLIKAMEPGTTATAA
jgi:EAL domain-containing protein (putative c-di-GMP-specific phosphodiesterase class I)